MKKFISIICLFLISAVLIGTLSGCSLDDTPSDTDKISITNIRMSSEYQEYIEEYRTVITGSIKNISNKNLSYVCVELVLYDALGNNLDTVYISTTNLFKNDNYNFNEVSYDDSKPTSYRIAEISVW